MAYMEQLQGAVKSLAQAGESGRRNLDSMMGPVNSAIGDLSGAAAELEGLPIIGDLAGGQLRRVMGRITAAQSRVGAVVATYNRATRALSGIDERLSSLNEQSGRALSAAKNLIGKAPGPALLNVLPSRAVTSDPTPATPAIKPFPHLLIMQPHDPNLEPYYFNLDTAAFNSLSRRSSFNWAAQTRLSRRPAQQAVGFGDDRMTLSGDVFPGFRAGIKQLENLRSLAGRLQPLNLVTGYGAILGSWCLLSVQEEQSALLHGGAPRKQKFTLELSRYGDDLAYL